MVTRLLLAGALLCAVSCGDDDELPASCAAIVEACHDVDTGEGMIHVCHESAEEDWTAAECTAMTSVCLSACGATKPN